MKTLGFFGSGCIAQLPKDGSVTKNAFLELTLEQAMEYFWKCKTYTIDSFDFSASTTINVPPPDSPYSTSYAANVSNPVLSSDAFCRQTEVVLCSYTPNLGDLFQSQPRVVFPEDSPYTFNDTTTAESGSVLTTNGDASVDGPSNLGLRIAIGWSNFGYIDTFCDYESTPRKYYIRPSVGAFFRGTTYPLFVSSYSSRIEVGNPIFVSEDYRQAGTFTLNFLSGSTASCPIYYLPQLSEIISGTSCSCNASIRVTSLF